MFDHEFGKFLSIDVDTEYSKCKNGIEGDNVWMKEQGEILLSFGNLRALFTDTFG